MKILIDEDVLKVWADTLDFIGSCNGVAILDPLTLAVLKSSVGDALNPPTDGNSSLDLADWEDIRVQSVYELLCSDEVPPRDEHWEGYTARRIVAELEKLNAT